VSENITAVNDQNFEDEVINSEKPVLVDYWAEWCGPCKAIAPVLDDVASEYADTVKITKMNIDENPTTPTKYGIRSIPTLMLFKNGEVVSQHSGTLSKPDLKAMLDANHS